jgi:uncharacterized membrane protein
MTEETAGGERLNLRPGLIGSTVALLVSTGISIWGWTQIPDGARLPAHWGVSGEVDRFGSKTEALITLPLVMLGLCVMFIALSPLLRQQPAVGATRLYTVTWIGVLILMAGLHTVSVVNGVGGQIPVPQVSMAGIGALFLVMGNYLPKTRSNRAVGVRTPWTMRSERSWQRTGRLTGWLFAGLGLILLVLAFIAPPAVLFSILIVGTFAAAVVPLVHSWWTRHPDPGDSPADAER